MICQIEITTHCNAKCFYCPNGYLDKQHMPIEQFKSIVDTCPNGSLVLMQGTGEPLLHPFFWEMAAYARSKGNQVGIITNGSISLNNEQLHQIDSIGISVDTICPETAKRSGRPDPVPILDAIVHYHAAVPEKIRIYTVDYGQDFHPLQSFAITRGIGLTVQRIQCKTSYQKRYSTPHLPYRNLHCRYIVHDIHRYYFVNGKQAPCAYMIDAKNALSAQEVVFSLNLGVVPQCCSQCGELVGIPRLSARAYGKVHV